MSLYALPIRRPYLFAQGWVLPGAAVDMDFANGRYYGGSLLSLLSTSRASTGYAQTQSGLLVPFAANVPRITDLGLLVEEARTNLVLRSQEFDNASWTKGIGGVGTGVAPVVTADQAVAPDGTMTADLIAIGARSAATRLQFLTQAQAGTAALYRGTVYVKAATPGDIGLSVDVWQFDASAIRNVATVVLTANWQRAATAAVSNMVVSATDELIAFGRAGSAAGGNTELGAVSFHAWGAQGELGAFPTSYIPTTTVAVTRAADNIAGVGSFRSALQGSAWSLLAQANSASATGGSAIVGANATLTLVGIDAATLKANAYNGAVNLLTANSITASANNKFAASANASGRSVVTANGTVATDANAVAAITGVSVGSFNAGASAFMNGYIQRLTAWNSRLPDATLKALTA